MSLRSLFRSKRENSPPLKTWYDLTNTQLRQTGDTPPAHQNAPDFNAQIIAKTLSDGPEVKGLDFGNTSSDLTSSDSSTSLIPEPIRPNSPVTAEVATASYFCKGCSRSVASAEGGVVVAFGDSLWHVECFCCSKCQQHVTADTNLLLLSDGSPVCRSCSYTCTVCNTAILDEAIFTGDESYHVNCFRCKTCHNRIEELVFAKTSMGIYCVKCHNERVARAKRFAERKKKRLITDGGGPPIKKESETGFGAEERDKSEESPVPLNTSSSTSDDLVEGTAGINPTSPGIGSEHEAIAPVKATYEPDTPLDIQSLDLTNSDQTISDNFNPILPVHDLSGCWEKLEEFACSKGGNSDIYKARLFQGPHPHPEQLVAVKMLRSVRIRHGSLADDILHKRFQREVKTWGRLDHCHVVPFLGFAFEGYFPCLVAPWYQNGDLTDYIRDHPDCDRTTLVTECMDGLIYLHSLEPPVIHGDLKASNILVDDDGKARLTEFGLSRFLQEGPSGFTTSSTLCGTPRWMAPELLNGNSSRPTTASDVYALILLALEIYTQKQPFPDLDQWRFFMAMQKGQSPQRSDYTPFDPPEQIWQVFEKGWSLDPTQRPAALGIKIMFITALSETDWQNK